MMLVRRRARAKETDACYTPRFRTEGIVGAPQRGAKGRAQRDARETESAKWWGAYSKHRAVLNLQSVEGSYRTHIEPIVDKPWPEVTVADRERLRAALDGKAQSRDIAAKTAFNDALFDTDDTRKRLRFHDLRGTGLTWMAIRGDDPLKIQQRAAHRTFEMTQKSSAPRKRWGRSSERRSRRSLMA